MNPGPLATKLKLKVGQKPVVVEAPAEYLWELDPLQKGGHLPDHLEGKYDWLQVFAKDEKDLVLFMHHNFAAFHAEFLLWTTFPRGSSKIQTDLTRDKGWDLLRSSDLKLINLVSANALGRHSACVLTTPARNTNHLFEPLDHS